MKNQTKWQGRAWQGLYGHKGMAEQEALYSIAITPPELSDGPRDIFATAPVRIFKSYLLGHIYAGEGQLLLENRKQEVRLRTGSVVILTPGTPHVYGNYSGSDYREDFVFFSGHPIDCMAESHIIETGCYMLGNNRRLPEIAALLRNPSMESQFRARVALVNLLLEIHSLHGRHPRRQVFSQLLAELAAHPERWWTVEDMAEYCKCSTAQLRRNFQDFTGMLPKSYIEKMKMHLAAEKLVSGNDSIEEICRKLGYADRFHFSRRFREIVGIAPGQYRKNGIKMQ